jgi:putative ABC transport system permease protein
MNLRESMGIALGALRANKMRSFLTLLGTIIGVAALTIVLSLVEGLNRVVADKLLHAGSNVFILDKWGFLTSQDQWEAAQNRPEVTIDDADAVRLRAPHAALVVAQDNGFETVQFRGKKMKSVQLGGRSAGYDLIDDLTIADGRHLTEFDDQHRRMVCVIGPELVEEFFPGMDPIGRTIRVGTQSYQVLGTTVAKGKLFGQSQDRFVIVPIRVFQKYERERESIEIAIKSVDQSSLPLAQQEVRNIMRGRHHLGPTKQDNFGIQTSETWLQLYHTLTGGLFFFASGVTFISLIVGAIVIMNIMLVSVTERTREIGVRKAMGGRRKDILTQFLVEATTISLSGGLIGILLGALVALLAGAVTPLPAVVSFKAVGLGIALSTLIGVASGMYPAWRAARLDPIDALRYE